MRLYVGNLNPRAENRDLEDAFKSFGSVKDVWVARKPPGFAFVEFDVSKHLGDLTNHQSEEER